ncbi:unnamed protein product [Diamesa serratosioi]
MKLENYLFCIPLEIAGLIFGAVGILINGFLLLSMVGLLTSCLFGYLEDLNNLAQAHMNSDLVNGQFATIVTALLIISMVLAALIWVHVLLIKGITNKQHEKMKPWLIINVIATAMFLIRFCGILDDSDLLTNAVCVAIFHAYDIMAVRSLYNKIKNSSQNCFVINILYSGTDLPLSNNNPKNEQPEAKDFDYVNIERNNFSNECPNKNRPQHSFINMLYSELEDPLPTENPVKAQQKPKVKTLNYVEPSNVKDLINVKQKEDMDFNYVKLI